MSYLVLARKSRPQTFDQVVGQRPVVRTLQNSIARNRVAHAILFSGVRGVGKTTLARLMAKALNCTGETDSPPCDACPSCKEIALGNSLDLYEIDGASNRGIQEIRELKEKIRFLPTSSTFKIIIIDEVHMLTTEAFNALLKTLEEPPAHVHFMFATTEIHKIPVTILSRCQQYELKRIPAKELQTHFGRLAEQEGFTVEPSALSLIAREAGGSVRDGLSLLDQMFSFGEQHITPSDVTEVLGLVDHELILNIAQSLLESDRTALLHGLSRFFQSGMDSRRFLEDLMGCFRNLLLTRIDRCEDLIDLPDEELKKLRDLAAPHTHEQLHLKLTMLMQLGDELRHTMQPQLTIETGFLRIIETANVVPVSRLIGKMDELLNQLPDQAPPVIKTQPASAAENEAQPQTSTQPEELKTSTSPIEDVRPAEAAEPPPSPPVQEKTLTKPTPESNPVEVDNAGSSKPDKPVLPASAIMPGQDSPQATPDKAAPVKQVESGEVAVPEKKENEQKQEKNENHEKQKKEIRRNWPDFIAYVKERKLWMGQVLDRADKFREEPEGELHLHYDDTARCALLRHSENLHQLAEFAMDFFQRPLKVCFVIPESDNSGPHCTTDGAKKLRQLLEDDPLVQSATEIFTGTVGDIRIGPRSR